MRPLPVAMAVTSLIGLLVPVSDASAAPVYCKLNPTFAVAQVIWVDGAGPAKPRGFAPGSRPAAM
ncbi:MAG: hypothetical protein ABIP19_14745 [Dermatophilaceae bacterium]